MSVNPPHPEQVAGASGFWGFIKKKIKKHKMKTCNGAEVNTVYIAPVTVWKCSKLQERHIPFHCIMCSDQQRRKRRWHLTSNLCECYTFFLSFLFRLCRKSWQCWTNSKKIPFFTLLLNYPMWIKRQICIWFKAAKPFWQGLHGWFGQIGEVSVNNWSKILVSLRVYHILGEWDILFWPLS